MLEDQATILKFRADRVRQMQGAGNVGRASGTRATPDELRAWARQQKWGGDEATVEAFVERVSRTPGSGVAPPAIEPPAPRVEASSAGQAQADEAIRAMDAINANPAERAALDAAVNPVIRATRGGTLTQFAMQDLRTRISRFTAQEAQAALEELTKGGQELVGNRMALYNAIHARLAQLGL
jgi:hypothetical protein